DRFVPDIRSAFYAAMQDVSDNAVIDTMVSSIEAGVVVGAFQALGFTPAAMRPITAAIERAFEQGGVTMGETFPKHIETASGKAVFRFDVRNSRAEAWLRNKSSTLVQGLTDEARVNVRQIMQEGLAAGNNPKTIALDIIG